MKTIHTNRGLDIPISGLPRQEIRAGQPVGRVAILGDDFIGMKPTMVVKEGDSVKTGQLLFTDKKNPGVKFVAPACGHVSAINRGAKRKFESLVIELSGAESIQFLPENSNPEDMDEEAIRTLLINTGLWSSFRTRPYGKIPAVDSTPASLFITAMDTSPLAADPKVIIGTAEKEYRFGLRLLSSFFHSVPIHYCSANEDIADCEKADTFSYWVFKGPHPAGLPSTHIHFIDPVHENKMVWHIDYQDIIAMGHLLLTGHLKEDKVVSLAGPAALNPAPVLTQPGACLPELCRSELILEDVRVISGSVLSGHESTGNFSFLGRYHNQVSVLSDDNGRSLLNWAMPGSERFSVRPMFVSALKKKLSLPFTTALWGGKRAIYPLGTYDQVMPLDIIATSLLKTLFSQDTEKARDLGCLELVEEDLALCSFVCPGKNEFGPPLRRMLTAIEQGY